MPAQDEAKVDAFNKEVNKLIEGIANIDIKVNTKYTPGLGDKYQPITDIEPLDKDTKVNLDHQ